ncbi:hypothetical protein CLOM_g12555 [Closterium sp. NIES-68]|nr:hypothetical protein CLOM_g15935 [Closterium sp. NIES-68]GJP85383.1 hypothetical protein CLOP_g15493 [Closterium sp. NIES-67]GJP33900.1 hypothetical protein CLOM_g18403 [Closterium sp. NIES-68]GJP35672.1 hypothetical protein CLOM_g20189 [Closterium sp. NIES-68]GJP45485.1 hypothetical protein CLOM_g4870 [Closterium sp. NIES-68]
MLTLALKVAKRASLLCLRSICKAYARTEGREACELASEGAFRAHSYALLGDTACKSKKQAISVRACIVCAPKNARLRSDPSAAKHPP